MQPEQIASRLVAGGVAMVHALNLESVEEALDRRIAEAVAGPAHRRRSVIGSKSLAIGGGGVLGGLNRSSQHPADGGCDDDGKRYPRASADRCDR